MKNKNIWPSIIIGAAVISLIVALSLGIFSLQATGQVRSTSIFILIIFFTFAVVSGAAFSLFLSSQTQKALNGQTKKMVKLKENEEKYRTLIERTQDGVFIVQKEKIVYTNEAYAKMAGYTVEEFTGLPVSKIILPRELSIIQADHEKRVSGENVISEYDFNLVRKDGTTRNVKMSVGWITLMGKHACMGTARDITDIKRSEDLKKALNRINFSISSTLDINDILEKVVKEASKAIDAESGCIAMYENGYWFRRYVFNLPRETIGIRSTNEQTPHAALALKTKQPVVIKDAYYDTRVNTDIMKQFGFRSVLVTPLIIREEVIGMINFNYNSAPVGFDDLQVDFAMRLASLISLAIENARLYEEERSISNTLQEALLTVPEEIEGIDFGYLYRSATETAKVGGDFYDVFELEKPYVGIIVGDVSGKGVQAATLTSLVKDTVRAYAYQESSPSSILSKTNDVILKTTPSGLFVTIFFGIVNTETGSITYCSAGHPTAVMKRTNTSIDVFVTSSPAIGVLPNQIFFDEKAKINPGDVLILYSDGVTETRFRGKLFGEERLIDLIKTLDLDNTKEYPKAILDEIMDYSHSKLTDDVVLISVSLEKKLKRMRAA